jgi:hypothetical protein
MRINPLLASTLLLLTLSACSGVEIQPAPINEFAAGNYQYYKWRTEPLPNATGSSDPLYALDPIIRREVNADLQSKGYVLDDTRAQFTVDYLFAMGMLQGEQSELASNISPYPGVVPNRRIDQASVDNAIALGGVKETNNIVVQFNDRSSNRSVWRVTITKIVEDANNIDISGLEKNLKNVILQALQSLPTIAAQ